MVSHFFHSWMNPLFAAAHGANKAGRPMDPAHDIFALPEEMQAEHASCMLLELRARHPGDSLWASVFRLGRCVRACVRACMCEATGMRACVRA